MVPYTRSSELVGCKIVFRQKIYVMLQAIDMIIGTHTSNHGRFKHILELHEWIGLMPQNILRLMRIATFYHTENFVIIE